MNLKQKTELHRKKIKNAIRASKKLMQESLNKNVKKTLKEQNPHDHWDVYDGNDPGELEIDYHKSDFVIKGDTPLLSLQRTVVPATWEVKTILNENPNLYWQDYNKDEVTGCPRMAQQSMQFSKRFKRKEQKAKIERQRRRE